jgi:nucleoside-diphosphate-sugar epimerase
MPHQETGPTITSTMMHPITILGTGYSGRYLTSELTITSRPFFATSREPDKNLSHVPAGRRMKFDLAQPSTWLNIPAQADLIWCFPATPLDRVQAFARTLDASPRRMVILGSTSAYEISNQPTVNPLSWIDESAPIDQTKSRVQGEEYLREHHGTIVLRVAGIYGPGRNPLDWIRQGRVGPSRKYVNLIHVEDLAAICLLALDKGKPGETYNVGDGTPRTWEEICATAQQRWSITASATNKDPSPGKRISNTKLCSELGYRFQHPDLYTALQALT